VATSCEHIDAVPDEQVPAGEQVCEECARTGGDWVSLRRCLTCGHVGCCDSSPGRHATAHHEGTSHPLVRTLQPGQDWVWCYVDEVTLKRVDGDWTEVDLFFEVGLGYMREHLEAGRPSDLDEAFAHDKGFPLGRWVAEMRRRRAAGELGAEQAAKIDALPGWSWGG
jgi:Zn-finger in ubiquitin-hydrolases and other protein